MLRLRVGNLYPSHSTHRRLCMGKYREQSPEQTHHHNGTDLKGHGFSRANGNDFKRTGFSPWGKTVNGENRPSGPKGHDSRRLWAARLKPCPFKTSVPAGSTARCVCPGAESAAHTSTVKGVGIGGF